MPDATDSSSAERRSPSLYSDTASSSPTQCQQENNSPGQRHTRKQRKAANGLETLYEQTRLNQTNERLMSVNQRGKSKNQSDSDSKGPHSVTQMKPSAKSRGSLSGLQEEDNKRTSSVSNLTKYSDKSDQLSNVFTTKDALRGKLAHNHSEGNLKLLGSVKGNSNLTNTSYHQAPPKTLSHVKSQPTMLRQSNSENKLSSLNQRKPSQRRSKVKQSAKVEENGDDSDEDVDRDRIVQWLIGVEEADRPPSPEAFEEESPSQTDTAIHVVYNGDKK